MKSTYVKLSDTPTADAQKAQTITHIGFYDGGVVRLACRTRSSSGLRAFDYPFKAAAPATQIEMFHTPTTTDSRPMRRSDLHRLDGRWPTEPAGRLSARRSSRSPCRT